MANPPPSAGDALNGAVAAHRAGRLAEAERLYGEVLAHNANHPDALHWLGVLKAQSGRLDEALRLFAQALKINRRQPDVLTNQGRALNELRRHEDALASYDKALAVDPDHVLALHNRGTTLLALKRSAAALADFQKVLAIQPGYVLALHNSGIALNDLGRSEDAVTASNAALAVKPDYPEALHNRGIAWSRLRRYDRAVDDFERMLRLAPDFNYGRGTLLHAKLQCCKWDSIAEDREQVIAGVREGKRADRPFAFLAISDSPRDQLQCARTFAAEHIPAMPAPVWNGERYRHDRIRLAYVSGDFREHSLAYLMAELFERHDRARFETIAVSCGPDEASPMRTRLRGAFDRFIDVGAQGDHDVAKLMRRLEVDVAVDLMGFTQNTRTGILSFRPAPVQVSYLGYAGTMGVGYIDYIVADRHLIPDGERDFYTEKVVQLPDTYLVNDTTLRRPARMPTRADSGLPDTGFVFCSFNNSYKITPAMFDVWMRLLRAVEGSVLWLFVRDPAAAANLRAEAERRGVEASRLVFAPHLKLDEHLARQSLADLFLDTFPYNAHTTAAHALWAGVPLVTCRGTTFVGRVAASVLTAIGLPELITGSLDDYERLALQLATDADRLARLRAKLAAQRSTAPLFDTDRFRRHIEAAYIRMWERQQRGEPPAGFAVEAVE
jgi:predicted O-linked N-acetylglucosamine transferase (SPINDLY family)